MSNNTKTLSILVGRKDLAEVGETVFDSCFSTSWVSALEDALSRRIEVIFLGDQSLFSILRERQFDLVVMWMETEDAREKLKDYPWYTSAWAFTKAAGMFKDIRGGRCRVCGGTGDHVPIIIMTDIANTDSQEDILRRCRADLDKFALCELPESGYRVLAIARNFLLP
jgi:hypothetical protein